MKADILAQCMSTGEVPAAWQFCSKYVSLICAWSLPSPSHLGTGSCCFACLVRLRQGPRVSKRLVRPRIKKNQPNHILFPADKAVSAETGLEGSGLNSAQTFWDQFQTIGERQKRAKRTSWDTGKTHSFSFRHPNGSLILLSGSAQVYRSL